MLNLLIQSGLESSAHHDLVGRLDAVRAAVEVSARRGNRRAVADTEEIVSRNPGRCFVLDNDGAASLTTAGGTWSAGRFETASLGTLRQRARARQRDGQRGRVRLWVIDGVTPITDIGSLQATADRDTLFQVASQFNCLESPGPYVTPVAGYFSDPTQGPRAAISAWPATLLRHYFAPAPDGGRIVQSTDGPQLELLADVCEATIARARNGYLTAGTVPNPAAFVAALETRFDQIRVGVHDRAQVVLGYDWDGSVKDSRRLLITQVLTSTVAGGGYGGEGLRDHFEPTCRHLLRAAYLGTLLAAASLGRTKIVLTLIGGGAFGNPVSIVWDSIQWALADAEPLLCESIDVFVNGRDLAHRLPRQAIIESVRRRGGAVVTLEDGKITIDR